MQDSLGVIDMDVHPALSRDFLDVAEPYLDRSRHRRLMAKSTMSGYSILATSRFPPEFPINQVTAASPEGAPPGSDPVWFAKDLLDRHGVALALLVPLIHTRLPFIPLADDGTALSRAFNDFFIDEWLPTDPRYRLLIGVNPRDPAAAADEVRRIGQHDGVVGILMTTTDINWGMRHYDPLYDVAQEYQLPIVAHVHGQDGESPGSSNLPGGPATFSAQRNSLYSTIAMANIASLVFDGAFMRFPTLKFAFLEYGFSWAPSLMWKLDARWKEFRPDTPWVKRPPSEYIIDRVRLSTQPVDQPQTKAHLQQILEMCHADRTLMFSSDYPHFDSDLPRRTMRMFTDSLQQRVFRENALESFPRLGTVSGAAASTASPAR